MGKLIVLTALVALLSLNIAQEDTAKSCGKCHQDIYQEWLKSTHSTAFTNPNFIRSLGDAKDSKLQKANEKNCLPCHAPKPILPKLKFPKLRKMNRNEGITCISCHQYGSKGSTMCGPFDTPDAPHDWKKVKKIQSAKMCTSCHTKGKGEAVYFLQDHYLSWKKNKLFTCQDCHMPEVERALAQKGDIQIKRKGRKHSFGGRQGRPGSGKMNLEMLKKALTVKITPSKGKVQVAIKNADCGHAFPGMGYITFAAELVCSKEGTEVSRERQTVGEWLHGKSDTRLKPGETRKLTFKEKKRFDKVEIHLILSLDGQEEIFDTITQ